MISVIILAGGIGSRMKTAVPKQFIEINDDPIIVHTIRNFEVNPKIDNITIVCLEKWIPHARDIVKEYGLKKVNNIVVGGETGHISTKNGVRSLEGALSDDDYVIIHDAARPIVTQGVINDLIRTAELHGNACSAVSCYETVVLTENRTSGYDQIDRSKIVRVQTPQCYRYELLRTLYDKADRDNINDFVYANTMALHYGTEIFFSKGSNCNIKITTKDDITLFMAMRYYLEHTESED